jgi:hypothetical protein
MGALYVCKYQDSPDSMPYQNQEAKGNACGNEETDRSHIALLVRITRPRTHRVDGIATTYGCAVRVQTLRLTQFDAISESGCQEQHALKDTACESKLKTLSLKGLRRLSDREI